ncbi:thiamine transport system permease protein [Hoeflea marina]|uniref:Thiamine transport system permease protein n=1 Tax=Hoeflea marina TaxID=274592 RepID=A0A317PEY2_9HYPH|nr:thiamine/thiamine pyrophosphate ABC transporter permease ThiP [Hoeflea marina]PWV98190.1 thiamine transport system permease protein [Hoeflea marina]
MLTPAEHRAARLGGWFGIGLLAAAIGIPVAALLAGSTGAGFGVDPYLLRITRFTLLQAGLSTALSIALAIPLARALARHPALPGRSLLLRLFAIPLGLPPLVAALGLIVVWGRQGIVNAGLLRLGVDQPVSIYGLSGILMAHVFFNLPLATRLMLMGLERLPAEYWKNAAILGMTRANVFRLIEWPAIAQLAGGAAGLVFMLCVTSFTLVLVLGGGPAATTLEVAIYQALRFDFDPPRAVLLALVQIALTSAVLIALRVLKSPAEEAPQLGLSPARPDVAPGLPALADRVLILASALFVIAPLAATLVAGLRADLVRILTDALLWRAILTSLAVAAAAAATSTMLALLLVRARHSVAESQTAFAGRILSWLAGIAGSLVLLAPPVVMGAGWFLLLSGATRALALPLMIIVLINAMMALPFVIRVIEPAHRTAMSRNGRLCLSLGVTGINRLRRVDLPALARPLATAFAFAMALSLGDLGAVALFGGDRIVTLPWLLLQKMGSYRTADAAGIALILAVLCMGLMALSDRTGAGREAARP